MTKGLSDKWLSDRRLEFLEYKQRYLVVEITGTKGAGNARWFEGEYEGKQGIVVTVLDRGGNFTAVATIKTLPDYDEEIIVPIAYLQPVEPKVGDKAVPLDMALTEEQPLDVISIANGQCELSGPIYVSLDKVCLWQEWP